MLKEQIVSLDKFINNADKIVKTLNATGIPLILTKNDTEVAVVQNAKQYRKFLDAMSILKLMGQSEKDVQEGKGVEQSEMFRELNTLIESKFA